MTKHIENKNYILVTNTDTGLIEGLYNKNDLDGGNFLVSTEVLEDLGFGQQKNRLLGSTLFELSNARQGRYKETGNLPVN
ncbi:MAG: hypothetical protein GX323_00180, partial [Clostridiales bacterium]|nr:hypothetical protein [Clostridiales bacterium]